MRKTFFCLEKWMKIELLLMVLFTIGGSILVSVAGKMQGMLLTLSAIAVLAMISKSSGMILPIFRGIRTDTKYMVIVILGIIEIFILSLYFYIDSKIWIIIYILYGMPYSLFLSAFFIDYDIIIKDLTSTKMFMNIAYIERIMFSSVAILGSGLTYIFSKYLNIGEILCVVIFIKLISSIIAIQQYKNVYKGVSIKNESNSSNNDGVFLKSTLKEYIKR